MGYFSSWLRRTLIAVRGFFAWIKHSYPFVLLPSTLLLFVWLMEYGWLEKTIIFSLGMILVIAEMFNYAIEKLCNVVDSNDNREIKVIKDVCAGAVLISGVVLIVVSLYIIF